MKKKILLVDDHTIVLEGLRSIIEKQDSLEIVGTASDGREAIKKALTLEPDLVVLDLSMPDMNGIEAMVEILKNTERPIKFLALSMHDDRRFVSRALRDGASGYLLKECASQDLLEAINTVLRGGTFLRPRISDLVLNDYRKQLRQAEQTVDVLLSPREREVLQLIAEGHSTKDIAEKLSLSAKTIETHRSTLMVKLNMKSVAELTKYAIREGLTDLQ